MRIAHVIIGLDTGGAENALMNLALSARSTDLFESTIISLTDIGPIGNKLIDKGFEVHSLGMRSAMGFPMVFWRLFTLLRRLKPSGVQTYLYHADLIGGIASRLVGIENINWGIHTTDLTTVEGVSKLTILIMRISARLSFIIPKSISCVAKAAKRTHVGYGYDTNKITVISNGCDGERFAKRAKVRAKIRGSLGIDSRTVIIGNVSRFNVYKNHLNLIEAAKIIGTSGLDIKFLLVGRGLDHENQQLMDWLQTNEVRDKFLLVGEQANVEDYLNAMDIFSLHSLSEGMPMVLIEAMLSEVACVTTDVGDAALVVGETGIVIPPRDPNALAASLLELTLESATSRRARGKQARARAIKNFSIEATAEKFHKLYKSNVAN